MLNNPYLELSSPPNLPYGDVSSGPTVTPPIKRRVIPAIPTPSQSGLGSLQDLVTALAAPSVDAGTVPGIGDTYGTSRKPSNTVAPPAGTPTQHEPQVVPETGQPVVSDDTSRRRERIRSEIEDITSFLSKDDYFSQAEKFFGQDTVPPKPRGLQGMDALAVLVPALFAAFTGGEYGMPGAGQSIASGLAGERAATNQYQQDTLNRKKDVAGLAGQLRSAGLGSMQGIVKDVITDVRNQDYLQAQTERNRIQAQRWADLNRHQQEQDAISLLRVDDSAQYHQAETALGNLRAREAARHNAAMESYDQGRLIDTTRFHAESLADRKEELKIKHDLVTIARQKALTGTKDDTLQKIEGIQRLINSTTTELDTADPSEIPFIQNELQYDKQVLYELQQRAQQSGRLTTAPPGGSTTSRPRVKSIPAFVNRWQNGDPSRGLKPRQPVPKSFWDTLDPADQQQLEAAGVAHE